VRALFATSVMVLLSGFCGLAFGAVPLDLPGLGIFTLDSTGGSAPGGPFLRRGAADRPGDHRTAQHSQRPDPQSGPELFLGMAGMIMASKIIMLLG
jgi:hypothetical protein